MFDKKELEIIAQALANSQVRVGEAKEAMELLDKVVAEIDKPKKDR